MKLAVVTLWLLAGAAVAGGLYWAFLNTPESTVWSLAASALLFLVSLIVAGIAINGAILIWTTGSWRSHVMVAVRRAPAVLPAVLIVVALWWLVTHAETWITMRSGPINAWFIARFGWDDMSWLFTTMQYAAAWARWVLAGVLAVWLMACVMRGSKHRVSVVRIAMATIWFVLLIAVPWNYLVPWRPAALPATSLEVIFIGVKLSAAAVAMAVGAALIIREASPLLQKKEEGRI